MERGDKAAIVCCSNGQKTSQYHKIKLLDKTLRQLGLDPIFSDFIYAEDESGSCGTAEERAAALMGFYRDPEVKAIFDISGGDMANEILPYLDFSVIKESGKQFWGYSDLTTILNAIYARTGRSSVLYQVRNLIYDHKEKQTSDFRKTVLESTDDLYRLSYEFLQGDYLQGTVVGGNIRCLLKLAGTKYWPDMQDKVLLLEAMGGTVPKMVTYLSQLSQLGVFEQISGILLGTFTEMEAEKAHPAMEELVRRYIPQDMPVVKTREIGHGTDSKGIIIGAPVLLRK